MMPAGRNNVLVETGPTKGRAADYLGELHRFKPLDREGPGQSMRFRVVLFISAGTS